TDTDGQTADVLAAWSDVLDALARDPMECVDRLDSVVKSGVLQSSRQRAELDWDHAKLHLVDLQYHDLREDTGIHHRLARGGRGRPVPDPCGSPGRGAGRPRAAP